MSSDTMSQGQEPEKTVDAPQPGKLEEGDEAQVTQTVDETDPGDLRAWLTVLGGWLVLFTTFGYTNSFGVYQAVYTLRGTSSASNISWIGSIQLFCMFAIGLPAGRLFDQGYFHYTQALGSFVFVFGLFMLSLADPGKYYQLILSQGVCMGLGQGLLLVPAYAIQGHHWSKRRSMAMGIVSTGTSFGGIVYPIMLNQLFKGSAGFAWGVRSTAFLSMALLIVSNCVMTTRTSSKAKRMSRVGAPPDLKVNLHKVLTDVPFMVCACSLIPIYLGLFFPYFYLQLYANVHGNFSANFAFYTVSMLNAGSIPGRIIPNVLAQKFGHLTVLIPVTLVCGALNFVMFGLNSVGAVVIFSLLYGFFSGGFISMVAPTTATFSETVDDFGIRIGIGSFISAFALLAGSPIDGALLNPGLHWSKPILFSGIMITSSLVGLTYSRYGMTIRKGTAWV